VHGVLASEQWQYEIKWDGYRLAVHVELNGNRIVTRGGHNWTDRFPSIAAAARDFSPRTLILVARRSFSTRTGDRVQLFRQRPLVLREGLLHERMCVRGVERQQNLRARRNASERRMPKRQSNRDRLCMDRRYQDMDVVSEKCNVADSPDSSPFPVSELDPGLISMRSGLSSSEALPPLVAFAPCSGTPSITAPPGSLRLACFPSEETTSVSMKLLSPMKPATKRVAGSA
jgi:hypothetical protein